MKVSYPLSLKVSLWLILNLLLLAVLAVGFFVMQGGMGWSALVSGPSGNRAQSLFNVIAGEAAATTGDGRTAVLKRFGEAYDAEFFLLAPGETRHGGGSADIPAELRERIEPRGFGGQIFSGRPFGPGGSGTLREGRRETAEKMSGKEIPERAGRESREPADKGRFGPDGVRRGEPVFAGPPPEMRLGRFVLRTQSPDAFWVGMRVPFNPVERGNRILPAFLLARVNSLWSLLHLIGLQAWLLAGSVVLALSVLFWLPLLRGITRSVSQLTAATEKIAEGHFDTRVESSRRDELGRLGESVNRMATRLDAHMTGQKRFLGDVAHELCSPLARLQLATGILADQAPPNLRDTVTDVREEVQQMSTLVNELLAFTKAGLHPRDITLSPVELAPLAAEVLARESAESRVALAIAPALRVQADPALLARALANLVRNALRYAGDAGPITIAAAAEGDRVILSVEDEGPGVPATDLDRLGEPFFRPELSRSRESGGVGLGLAIVRTSIGACRGEVRFANRTPRGFRAELRLSMA